MGESGDEKTEAQVTAVRGTMRMLPEGICIEAGKSGKEARMQEGKGPGNSLEVQWLGLHAHC